MSESLHDRVVAAIGEHYELDGEIGLAVGGRVEEARGDPPVREDRDAREVEPHIVPDAFGRVDVTATDQMLEPAIRTNLERPMVEVAPLGVRSVMAREVAPR